MKKKISNYIEKYLKKHPGDENDIEALGAFLQEFFEKLDDEYDDVRDTFYDELENFAEVIDKEMLSDIIENLKHKDGEVSGQKWTIEETDSVAKQYDVENKLAALNKPFNSCKFWFAMNYVYAVHHSINRTINGYVDLAIDECTNKNICFDDLIKRIFEKI